MIILLDSNILGLICNDNNSFDEARQCQQWFYSSFTRGGRLITSDISNYEVMRGLISSSIDSGKIVPGIKSLESLKTDGFLEFLPVSTEAFDLAADLWARASTSGQTTRDEKDIDFDIIISAQYLLLKDEFPGQEVIVTTTNLKHLSIFCEAAHWRDINL
jgi:predicted nucleic acid-binding protein